jgi:pimeloyl-ACP methyl ester carboxylesterase
MPSGTPSALVVLDPKLEVMSRRTMPLWVSTLAPFEPSPGYGPAVSVGISPLAVSLVCVGCAAPPPGGLTPWGALLSAVLAVAAYAPSVISPRYPAEAVLDSLPAKLRSRWLRALVTPVALLAAKRITIENPADTIAMLRAEDAFDVHDRLEHIPTETLVVCGAQDPFWTLEMFAETACRLPRGRLIMYRDRGHALITAPEFFRDVTAFLRS